LIFSCTANYARRGSRNGLEFTSVAGSARLSIWPCVPPANKKRVRLAVAISTIQIVLPLNIYPMHEQLERLVLPAADQELAGQEVQLPAKNVLEYVAAGQSVQTVGKMLEAGLELLYGLASE